MKYRFFVFFILFHFFTGSIPVVFATDEPSGATSSAVMAAAQAVNTPDGVKPLNSFTKIMIPNAPHIAGTSFLLEDFNSGKVLAEKEADLKVEPASLTKVMTVYVVFKALGNGSLKLDDLVTVSENAWRAEGSRMFLKVSDRVKVEDLLQGVMVQSGNDASIALAEHIAGDEMAFTSLMNQEAAKLGMTNSHFENSTGLPHPGHLSTARDLAKLARAIIKEFPQYYRWDAQKEFTYNKITQPNRNLLLWRDPSVDGIKTGHTEAAGFCMLASAKRKDMRLISVVMGAASTNARANESENLLNFGFKFYETQRLYPAGQVLRESRVWKGDNKMVELGFQEDFYVTVPINHFNDLKATIHVDKNKVAPVIAGTPMGSVRFTLAGEPYFESPIFALKTVAVGGFFRRSYDTILRMVKGNE